MAERKEGYERIARTHQPKPSAYPLDKNSIKVRVASPRLPLNVRGQSRKGLGNPWK